MPLHELMFSFDGKIGHAEFWKGNGIILALILIGGFVEAAAMADQDT
jgi:uncharacterized membrane protein YhaH (DUF805 family)